MKRPLIICFMLLIITGNFAQEKNIETKSVSIENLITFIVENYAISNRDTFQNKNITFLLQSPSANSFSQDVVILKQAFKLLSSRLSEDDKLSIVTYSGINGVALKQTSPKNLKKILYAIDNLGDNIKELHEDGIILAYDYTKEHFLDDAINTIVMVRNPNSSSQEKLTKQKNIEKQQKKAQTGAVLITALSLLPELITVIKN